jgi:hypothetical protein
LRDDLTRRTEFSFQYPHTAQDTPCAMLFCVTAFKRYKPIFALHLGQNMAFPPSFPFFNEIYRILQAELIDSPEQLRLSKI